MGLQEQTLQPNACIHCLPRNPTSSLGALHDGRLSCYPVEPDSIASPQPSLRCTEYRPTQHDERKSSSVTRASFTPMDQWESRWTNARDSVHIAIHWIFLYVATSAWRAVIIDAAAVYDAAHHAALERCSPVKVQSELHRMYNRRAQCLIALFGCRCPDIRYYCS